MGLCFGIAGIPIFGDRPCMDEYRNDRNAHKAIEEASDVAKYQAKYAPPPPLNASGGSGVTDYTTPVLAAVALIGLAVGYKWWTG